MTIANRAEQSSPPTIARPGKSVRAMALAAVLAATGSVAVVFATAPALADVSLRLYFGPPAYYYGPPYGYYGPYYGPYTYGPYYRPYYYNPYYRYRIYPPYYAPYRPPYYPYYYYPY
jgi:hypothetical protein